MKASTLWINLLCGAFTEHLITASFLLRLNTIILGIIYVTVL